MLKPLILKIFNKSKERLKSTKIAPALRRECYTASIGKVKTLMSELGIKSVYTKRGNFANKNDFFKNRLKSEFTIVKPN